MVLSCVEALFLASARGNPTAPADSGISALLASLVVRGHLAFFSSQALSVRLTQEKVAESLAVLTF
jgi:hypothetical protein